MRPTRWPSLLAFFVVAAAISWGVLRVAETRGSTLPPLPWAAPVGLGAIAVAVLSSTVALRRRMSGRPGTKPAHPIGIARMAVLGKTSCHVGAVLGGGYAGYLLLLLPDLSLTARRDRALIAGLAVLASLVLTAAGLLLERACRVPPTDDETGAPSAAA
jgi:uncharacterized protein DUF3180